MGDNEETPPTHRIIHKDGPEYEGHSVVQEKRDGVDVLRWLSSSGEQHQLPASFVKEVVEL